jgi:molybdenum cofactor biosynthesis protein B
VWIATLSDSRNQQTDSGGAAIRLLLEQAAQDVVGSCILREDPETLGVALRHILEKPDINVLLCTGGTGIAPRDLAYELLQPLYERTIPGFGELFRMLSWQDIGSAALLSRASAGIRGHVLIFSIPGAPAAIDLAMRRLILPELSHLLAELDRRDTPEADS